MINHLGGNGTVWRADVCVVGAGPVGLAIATYLADRGVDVLLLESGGTRPDPQLTFQLGRGLVEGDPRFGELNARVDRGIGGTSSKWCIDLNGTGIGVRLAPIEPGVLARPDRGDGRPAWPLDHEEIAPWYDESLRRMGVRAPGSALDIAPSTLLPGLDQGNYVFARADSVQIRTRERDLQRDSITVLVDATVVGARPDAGGHGVAALEIANVGGASGTVEATSFILAAGTVETTRLLLDAKEQLPGLRDNDRIGRNLMDRPRLHAALQLDQAPPDWFEACALSERDGFFQMRRFLSQQAAVTEGSASSSFLLVPVLDHGPSRPAVEHRLRSWLFSQPTMWFPRLACRVPEPAAAALSALDRATYGARSAIVRSAMRSGFDTEAADWASKPQWRTTTTWRVTAISEQFASDDNHIELSDERDVLGRRFPRLTWGTPSFVTPAMTDSLQRASSAFESAGLGRLDWQQDLAMVSSCHMMGTVAIGDDERTSAADRYGRVRGLDNLYVAGNAVFPQSGHSNPTIGAIALGLRTADMLVGATSGGSARAAGTA